MEDFGFVFSVALAGLSLALWTVDSRTREPITLALRRYEQKIDHSLRFLRSPLRSSHVISVEIGFVVSGAALAVVCPTEPAIAIGVAALSLLPRIWTLRSRAMRVMKINAQVEPMLGAIARALVAAPSLGEALASAKTVVEPPLADELAEVLEEFRLGTNLNLALSHLSERVPSENLRIAVLTLKLGQKSGGRLAGILETTAATMREMERLEGILRTKTAEGKAQTVVIALMPVALVGTMHAMMPGYFAPLETTAVGNMIVVAAVGLWIGAIFVARQILAVDL